MFKSIVGALRALVVAAAASGAAVAAPLVYDEGVSGDLYQFEAGTTTLVLGVGLNSVKGTTGWAFTNTGGVFDIDSFYFVVPSGTQVTKAAVALTNNQGLGWAGWSVTTGVGSPPFDYLDVGNGSTVCMFVCVSFAGGDELANVPLEAGSYFVSGTVLSFDGIGSPLPGFGADYEFLFTVAAIDVPEPHTLALTGIGLAALAWRRRRQSHKS